MEEKDIKNFINLLKEKDKHIDITIGNEDIVIYGDDNKDYMQYSWKLFGNRPSKISIYSELNSELLWTIISELFETCDSHINQSTEIFFESMGKVQESTFYIQLTKFFSIYFVENKVLVYDEESEQEVAIESYCFDMKLYFNNKHITNEEMNTCISLFSNAIEINVETEDTKDSLNDSIFTLSIEDGNFSLDTLSLNEQDKDIFKYSFNNNILKDSKKIISSINKQDKSIDIICGERGVGKTDLVIHICKMVKKKVIIVPLGLIDNTFNNIMFLEFLKAHPNAVVLIEDCENFFDKKNQSNNMFSLNMLQIMEGIYSNTININFLLTMNSKSQSIDKNLMDSIYIKNVVEIDKLDKSRAIKLSEKLEIKGFDMKDSKSIKLIDIYKFKENNKILNKGNGYF